MASDQDRAFLEKRIKDLEADLAAREQDLGVFREELSLANEKLGRMIEKVQKEIQLASKIQKTLVPTEFPHIPGFEFSTKFVPSTVSGGDYFDIFEHEDKFRFGMILASSSGYSMSALFLSVLIKVSAQLEARKGKNPSELLMMMIGELQPNIPANNQASAFYAVINRRQYEMTYSGVGSIIALHFSYAEDKLNQLTSSSRPIDSEFDRTLQDMTISLNPRDRLILCSTGVTEAMNPEGEKFGVERLYKTILSAMRGDVHDLRNEILFQVEKFAPGLSPQRDLSVIVTEVKDRVIKLAKP